MVNTQKYGSEIVPPIPSKTGYTFAGWNETVADTMPTNDVTYTGAWSLDTYDIAYDLKGGSVTSNPASYTINSGDLTLENPTKADYIFTGWTGTGLYSENKSVTIESGSKGNRYYTATWKSASNTLYTVHHKREDLDGDYTILEVEALTGVKDLDTAAQAKTYVGFTAKAFVQKSINGDESTVVEILYDRNSYDLIFDANGGVADSTTNVKYESPITAPAVTRLEYSFGGWDVDVLPFMPAENTTYIAQWGVSAYDIQFNKNADDAKGSMNEQAFVYDVSENLTMNDYARIGYIFAGWNTSSEGSGTDYTDEEEILNLTSVDQDVIVLYAQWIPRMIPLGTGTLEDPYFIENFNTIKWVSENNTDNSGFSGKYFKQVIDIDMSSTTLVPWVAIGNNTNKFNGTYDGNGYSVENLYISQETVRQGLFGVIDVDGSVIDLGVTDADITCTNTVTTTGALTGALVGTLYGSVSRCYSTGIVTGDGNTGGLIGNLHSGTIKDSYSTCTVIGNGTGNSGWDQLGGLIGKLALKDGRIGSISNSYASGNVIAPTHNQVAGLTGEIDTDQEAYSVFATGTATGISFVEGIAGVLQGPIYNAYTTNDTSAYVGAGGSETSVSTNVDLSWFKEAINFTTLDNWHVDCHILRHLN